MSRNAILDKTVFGSKTMRYEPFRPDVIKALRKEFDIKSQRELSEKSGIPLDTIKGIESGRNTKPNHETMLNLGRFFKIYFYAEWSENGEGPSDC